MKTKLLKKIRRKYSWYTTKEGWFVLIDNYNENARIIDSNFLWFIDKLKKDWTRDDSWNYLVNKILDNFGYTPEKRKYKLACRQYKSKNKQL